MQQEGRRLGLGLLPCCRKISRLLFRGLARRNISSRAAERISEGLQHLDQLAKARELCDVF